MPTLTLKFKDSVVEEYRLEKDKPLTIGRGENNTVVVENLAVSGYHAKIDPVDDGFLLTDMQSKNGSFVNNQLVASHWLKHGDIITIGKHNLIFAYGEGESRPKELPGDMDQTMVMDTGKYRDMLAQSVAKMDPGAREGGPAPVLIFLAGGNEGDIKLAKKLTKVGKNSTSDIVVGGLLVGQTAATISKRPKGLYLSYVGGISKPKVNGEPIKETVKLEEFDMIEIGSAKMQLMFEKKQA